MTRRRVLLSLALVAIVGGAASPALANGQDTSRVCINATHDMDHPGEAPLCVWIPVDGAR